MKQDSALRLATITRQCMLGQRNIYPPALQKEVRFVSRMNEVSYCEQSQELWVKTHRAHNKPTPLMIVY